MLQEVRLQLNNEKYQCYKFEISFRGTYQQRWCEAGHIKSRCHRQHATANRRLRIVMSHGDGQLPWTLPAQPIFSTETLEPATGERNSVGPVSGRSVRQCEDTVYYSTNICLLRPYQANYRKRGSQQPWIGCCPVLETPRRKASRGVLSKNSRPS